jgi:uncharacterized peroxidase-related enzyme
MAVPEYEQMARHEGSQPVQAANLPVVSEDHASPEVQRMYMQFRKDFGRPHVPGILQCFATHPPLLEHMMGFAKSMLFVDGALDRRHKEMIAAFVSSANQCDYCTDSHALFFRMQGGTTDTLNAVLACDLQSSAITPEQRILLQFVKKVTEASQAITPEDIDTMRAAGWSDLQIAEAIHMAALFACFNRVVNAFGLPSQELLKLVEDGG